MNRKIYIKNELVSLAEYIKEIDDIDLYECWGDRATEDGYNHKMTSTFDEFKGRKWRQRFTATVIRNSDDTPVGSIFVSPEDCEPDLAFMIYAPYRRMGYGSAAFELGVKYCFEVLNLDYIYAGCYEGNIASEKIITKCGFIHTPEIDEKEKHYLSGKPIVQRGYMIRKPK